PQVREDAVSLGQAVASHDSVNYPVDVASMQVGKSNVPDNGDDVFAQPPLHLIGAAEVWAHALGQVTIDQRRNRHGAGPICPRVAARFECPSRLESPCAGSG